MTTTRRFRLPFWLISAVVIGLLVLMVMPYFAGFGQPLGYEPQGPPPSFPELEARVEVTPDPRPGFQFDPTQPWQIDLGRGSGMDGLDTVALVSDGRAVLHRARQVQLWNGYSRIWERSALAIPPDAVKRVADAITANHLPGLGRIYDGTMFDGTQWVLWVRQGGREKVVYLNNHFPEPVVKFAAAVDAELVAAGDAVRWQQVPWWTHEQHDNDLWNAIKR